MGLRQTTSLPFLSANDTTHSLRNSDFVLPRFDTKRYGKHCIRYLGPLLWTKLSKDLKNSPTVATFRTKIIT